MPRTSDNKALSVEVVLLHDADSEQFFHGGEVYSLTRSNLFGVITIRFQSLTEEKATVEVHQLLCSHTMHVDADLDLPSHVAR